MIMYGLYLFCDIHIKFYIKLLHKIFILQFRLLCNTLLIWFYSSRHVSAFIGHLQVFYFFWPNLLLVLPFVILLKFLFKNFPFLKILRHNFSQRITPVSLLCCRLLDRPCPALLLRPFLVYTLLLHQRMALLLQCVRMLLLKRELLLRYGTVNNSSE
jgi:hypothetical protein